MPPSGTEAPAPRRQRRQCPAAPKTETGIEPLDLSAGDIRAISIRQPWAWAVAQGWKTIENRSRGTGYRGVLAIHAPKRVNTEDENHLFHLVAEHLKRHPESDPDRAEHLAGNPGAVAREYEADQAAGTSAIVGIARIVDVIREEPDGDSALWYNGDVGLVLEDARALIDPVRTAGALGLWHVTGNLEIALQAELDAFEKNK